MSSKSNSSAAFKLLAKPKEEKRKRAYLDECLELFRLIEFHRILTVKVNHKLPGKLKTYAVSQSEYLVVKLFVNVVGILMAPSTF